MKKRLRWIWYLKADQHISNINVILKTHEAALAFILIACLRAVNPWQISSRAITSIYFRRLQLSISTNTYKYCAALGDLNLFLTIEIIQLNRYQPARMPNYSSPATACLAKPSHGTPLHSAAWFHESPDLRRARRTGLSARRARRAKSSGPKGLQLEIRPLRGH